MLFDLPTKSVPILFPSSFSHTARRQMTAKVRLVPLDMFFLLS